MFRDPIVNSHIEIKEDKYFFTGVPYAPGITYAEIGRKAKVYRLVNGEKAYALKVFKPRYRTKSIVENTKRIMLYQDVPGLSVANRTILTPEEHSNIIMEHTSFAYAVLMPWIEGKTWFNYVAGQIALEQVESINLARALVRSVNELEKRILAHCDLSSSNFIFTADYKQVELIDIEDLFGGGLEEPQERPAGTGGYAPQWIKDDGIWEAGADRFAVGILISEILGWQFTDVRELSYGETFFSEGEFGKKTQRFKILAERLEEIHPELSVLFKTVWYAESVEECPRVDDWNGVLEKIRAPELLVTPKHLDFGKIATETAKSGRINQRIEIRNNGGGILDGQIRSNVPWLKVDPPDFRCGAGEASQHEVELILTKKGDFKIGNHQDTNALQIICRDVKQSIESKYFVVSRLKNIPSWIFRLSFGLLLLVFLILIVFYWPSLQHHPLQENKSQISYLITATEDSTDHVIKSS